MTKRLFKSESKFLEKARTGITNAETNDAIKAALADYNMGDEQVAVGRGIYNATQKIWDANIKEDAESTEASLAYSMTYKELQAIFKEHRDKALIFFKRHPEILVKLGVKGEFPRKYNDFFDKVRLFYTTIKNDQSIQAEMDKIKLTTEVVVECLTLLEELLAKRSYFDKELAESQDMTKNKNAALLALKEWMDDFYAVAKVALYDQPQLLEALGVFVRS
ncbi:hypothetical protein [Carboxylicivirga sp. M1479]|uniref:hypothetical protein n=1 Tax=Carboxylicivirga sp. M1479 TaxID=2594476 RepID=UPI001177894D|nr:hypothetical protein [Carboxylicivirga sp. M1479]TRX63984.1 hypothetical protein FNN09_18240 [Carboxylicivirga sp. M1479]